ncbi:MAG: hypothetical protein IJV35_01800, partial [Neisseriaceae bacterium]|nr:hypothetical protein [Neisseriaceae bacterium]
MNKIYRTVYNETTGTWVAVEETAKSHRKSNGGVVDNTTTSVSGSLKKFSIAAAVVAMVSPFMAETAQADVLCRGTNDQVFAYTGNDCNTGTLIFRFDGNSDSDNNKNGNGIAMGSGAMAYGSTHHSIAIGQGARAVARDTSDNYSAINGAIAIGANAWSHTQYSITIGSGGTGQQGLGGRAAAKDTADKGGYSIAIGKQASNFLTEGHGNDYYANTLNSTAIGRAAHTHAVGALAIGFSTDATAARTFALGTANTEVANLSDGKIPHKGSRAGGQGSVVIGDQATAYPYAKGETGYEHEDTSTLANDSVAIGTGTHVKSRNSLAFGGGISYTYYVPNGNSVDVKTAYYDNNVWRETDAGGNPATAEGLGATVGLGADGAIAFGGATADITGEDNTYYPSRLPNQIGNYVKAAEVAANAKRSIALGGGTEVGADSKGAVALGGDTDENDPTIHASKVGTKSDSALALIGGTVGNEATGAIAVGNNAIVNNYSTGSVALGGQGAADYQTKIGTDADYAFAAIGGKVADNATGAIAVGNDAQVNAQNQIAIGTGAIVDGDGTNPADIGKSYGNIAIGVRAHTIDHSENQIAIGKDATTRGQGAIALGSQETYANDKGSIAIGNKAKASQDQSIAIGQNVNNGTEAGIGGRQSIAIGAETQSTGIASIAIGGDDVDTAKSGGASLDPDESGSSTAPSAITATTASGNVSMAIGLRSQAGGDFSQAIGYKSQTGGSIDLSANTQTYSVGGAAPQNVSALGSQSGSGEHSVAVGYKNTVTGQNSTAVGQGNIVLGNNSGAFGDPSIITNAADNSYSVGNNNIIGAEKVFALGNNITKTAANSVFLGDSTAYVSAGDLTADNAGSTAGIKTYFSNTKAIKDVNGNEAIAAGKLKFAGAGMLYTDGSGNTYTAEQLTNSSGNFVYQYSDDGGVTWKQVDFDKLHTAGVVSVGDKGQERRIQNVAAGLIDENSTDAINGSQLYSVVQNLQAGAFEPIKFKGDAPSSKTIQPASGELLNVFGGETVTGNTDTKNISVASIDSTTPGDKKLEITLDPTVDLGSLGSLKIGDTYVDNDEIQVGVLAERTTIKGNRIEFTGNKGVISNLANHIQDDGTAVDTVHNDFHPNEAASVQDVLNSGWNIANNSTTIDLVQHQNTVNFKNSNTAGIVVKTADNKTSDVEVNVAKVTSGSTYIGVTGGGVAADGTVSDYVLTFDDTALNNAINQPLTFGGNTGTPFDRKLGETVKVVGVATAGGLQNITVNANDTANQLEIALNPQVDLGDSGSLKTG